MDNVKPKKNRGNRNPRKNWGNRGNPNPKIPPAPPMRILDEQDYKNVRGLAMQNNSLTTIAGVLKVRWKQFYALCERDERLVAALEEGFAAGRGSMAQDYFNIVKKTAANLNRKLDEIKKDAKGQPILNDKGEPEPVNYIPEAETVNIIRDYVRLTDKAFQPKTSVSIDSNVTVPPLLPPASGSPKVDNPALSPEEQIEYDEGLKRRLLQLASDLDIIPPPSN